VLSHAHMIDFKQPYARVRVCSASARGLLGLACCFVQLLAILPGANTRAQEVLVTGSVDFAINPDHLNYGKCSPPIPTWTDGCPLSQVFRGPGWEGDLRGNGSVIDVTINQNTDGSRTVNISSRYESTNVTNGATESSTVGLSLQVGSVSSLNSSTYAVASSVVNSLTFIVQNGELIAIASYTVGGILYTAFIPVGLITADSGFEAYPNPDGTTPLTDTPKPTTRLVADRNPAKITVTPAGATSATPVVHRYGYINRSLTNFQPVLVLTGYQISSASFPSQAAGRRVDAIYEWRYLPFQSWIMSRRGAGGEVLER
jgi:hypothetical protein